MRILLAAMAALMLAALPTRAADIVEFTPDMLMGLATAVGGTNAQRVDQGGGYGVVFEVGGRPYVFLLDFCSPSNTSKCAGVLMLSGFKPSANETIELFNEFHNAAGAITAVMIDKDAMAFVRHVLAPGGITTENVKENFTLLRTAPELYVTFLRSRAVASIAPPNTALLSHPAAEQSQLQPLRLSPVQLKAFLARVGAKPN